jgi:hypothetical protein
LASRSLPISRIEASSPGIEDRSERQCPSATPSDAESETTKSNAPAA